MSVWVVIPVKPLNRAKSRLAGVLSAAQRRELAETMLRHVLTVMRDVPEVTGTLIISRDPKALAIAREYGAHTVQESGTPELNAALTRATQVIASRNGGAVLVLPADLPLINAEDVLRVVEMGKDPRTIVIATDEHEDGTNALLMRPPGLIPYAYGPGSYRRHVMAAHRKGAHLKVYQSERLLLDIDMPDDLEHYRQQIAMQKNAEHVAAASDNVLPDSERKG